MKWEYKTLDQLGIVSRGKSKHRPRNDPTLFGGEYPFIQTADVKATPFYISEYSATYNEKGLEQSKLWHAGTLCITIAANIADTGILAMDACFPDSVMGFVPYDEISDVRFVKYSFDILQAKCKKISQGTAQDNLSWEKLSTIQFPAPPFATQKRIADILSTYDEMIENSQKQIKLLEEAAHRMYKEWFVNLRFPGYENTEIVEGVPEGWQQLLLDQVAPILTGKKDANFSTINGQYPFFTCAQIPLQAPAYSFDCNAVILAGNGDFNVKLYRGQFEAYQRTYVLSPKNEEMLFLLFHAVKTSMAKLAQGASGSTIKFLTKGMIASIPVYVPDTLILKKFNEMSEAIQEQVENLKSMIAHATEDRDRLLPKLMGGEIEV